MAVSCCEVVVGVNSISAYDQIDHVSKKPVSGDQASGECGTGSNRESSGDHLTYVVKSV